MKKMFHTILAIVVWGGFLLFFPTAYADKYQYTLTNNTSRDLQCAVGLHGTEYHLGSKQNNSQSVTFFNFFVTCEPVVKKGSSETASSCTFSRPPAPGEKDIDTIECYIEDSSGKKTFIKAALDPASSSITLTERK